jgi:hypothetical protein
MREALSPHQRLYGCDVDKACAAWCRENIGFAETHHTAMCPPLPFADQSIDFVYALSVFSHLRLAAQFSWARELHRILRPGGVLMMSTHALAWLSLVASLDYFTRRRLVAIGVVGLFGEFARENDPAIEGQREVACAISAEAIAEVFSPLRLLAYTPVSRMAGGQSVSILTRDPGTLLAAVPVGDATFIAERGASYFRAFLASAAPVHGLEAVRLRYAWGEGGGSCGEVPIGCDTLFGPDHLMPIAVFAPGGAAARTLHIDLTAVPGAVIDYPIFMAGGRHAGQSSGALELTHQRPSY